MDDIQSPQPPTDANTSHILPAPERPAPRAVMLIGADIHNENNDQPQAVQVHDDLVRSVSDVMSSEHSVLLVETAAMPELNIVYDDPTIHHIRDIAVPSIETDQPSNICSSHNRNAVLQEQKRGTSTVPGSIEEQEFSRDIQRSSTSPLFIAEHTPFPISRRPRPATNAIFQSEYSAPRAIFKSRHASMFESVVEMQKKLQERKRKAEKLTGLSSQFGIELDDEAYLNAVRPTCTLGSSLQQVPHVDREDLVHSQALAEFQRQKRRYDGLKRANGGKLSFREDIEWMRIRGAEDARANKRIRDLQRAEQDEEGPGIMDIFPTVPESDDQGENLDYLTGEEESSRKRSRRDALSTKAKLVSIQDAELQSMKVALEAFDDLPKKKSKKDEEAARISVKGKTIKINGSKSKSKAGAKKGNQKANGVRKTAKKKRETEKAMKQTSSLFHANVFRQQASVDAKEQPTFRSRVKADALKELIASVPIGDRREARGEMNELLAATRDFDGQGAVRSDGKGMWEMKGMSTSLKAYQILGAAFMRRRENAAEEPRGGLLADQMGLGKTLMMLANIINSQPPRSAGGPKTTLLVASPALLTQWKGEIEMHSKLELRVMRYGAGNRLVSNQACKVLESHDIILTTYAEVMRSYPKHEPPVDCQTAEQKIVWWKKEFEQNRGVLHRMIFLRVVLDEAQAIKNHTGRTSLACRALMAEHKWALSGTPVLNSLTELYPYFKFLGVPHTGSFKIFKHNYCDTSNPTKTERLLSRLAQFMMRRTHADEMFGAPILKLPQADQITYYCQFNPVERCIYEIVRQRFSKRINMWSKAGAMENGETYSNACVLLLRLRQLTAHVLMLQLVLKDLLELEDIEKIKQVVNDHAADENTQTGKTILAVRKQLDILATDEKKRTTAGYQAKAKAKKAAENGEATTISEHAQYEVDENVENQDNVEEVIGNRIGGRGASGQDFGKDYNFKGYLNSLTIGPSWEEAKKRATCSYCEDTVRHPCVMPCGHLVCATPCWTNMFMKSAEEGTAHSKCKICGVLAIYAHGCDPDDYTPEAPTEGTRSKAAKKKRDSQRMERQTVADDWLKALGDEVLPSAKTIAVKAQIINWIEEDPRVKIIVYTQFLAMIKILGRICAKEGWQVEQYHGNMSVGARDKAIANFTKEPGIRVMVASLRSGGLGLNLTMASKVIMMDPWWNSASEQQAFCRVFRIGQVEQTLMSRLCVKDTVDQNLINMQERKDKEIDSVMKDDGSKVKNMTVRDLMRLFGNIDEDENGRPFIMVDNPDGRGGFRAGRDDEGYADES